jgi:Xaa-Pro aminopeptidase
MSNIERIRQSLTEYKCEAMLVINHINRLFATGFLSSAGALLVTADDAWLIVDSRYSEAAQYTVSDAHVILLNKNEKQSDRIKTIVKDNNITSVGFEDDTISYTTYKQWLDNFDVELIPAKKLLYTLRDVKSRAEIDKMIKAQRLAEKVFEDILPLISTDKTEKELAAEIIYRSLKLGADDKAFNPIVVSGKNSSRPHGVPGDEKIRKGFLTIDFGVILDGWCSDTTRTLCIGKPDEEMTKVYNTVLEAQQAGIQAVHGGVKGIDVDTAARSVIENAGYGDYFGHGFGHSIGLEVHEPLKASQLSEDILPAGAVISAEPGIYLPGRYGVRIEDVLYITQDGCENITKLPKALTIL